MVGISLSLSLALSRCLFADRIGAYAHDPKHETCLHGVVLINTIRPRVAAERISDAFGSLLN